MIMLFTARPTTQYNYVIYYLSYHTYNYVIYYLQKPHVIMVLLLARHSPKLPCFDTTGPAQGCSLLMHKFLSVRSCRQFKSGTC